MQIIPVIDLKNGRVVHARAGLRQLYQPVQSVLCHTAQIEDVIHGFLKLFPFKTIYVADLDMLSGEGDHSTVLQKLVEQFTDIQFWIDQGCKVDPDQYPENWIQVIGTESIDLDQQPDEISLSSRRILSLDFNNEIIGNNTIANCPEYWPDHVIVMTLNRVGTNSGPDWQRLQTVLNRSMHSHITAAGGIRNQDDLLKLSRYGVENALIATALHSGQISSDDIHMLSRS